MNAGRFVTSIAIATLGLALNAAGASAQEADEFASSFSRIEGGAVFDYKFAMDGGALKDRFWLIHVVCTDGSKSLRVMLPVSPQTDCTIFDSNGPKSTLKKRGAGYEITFLANGRKIRKPLEVKNVNDPKSAFEQQFVVRVDYGDPLWNAMTSSKDDAAMMLIGEGGTSVGIIPDPKLDAALTSCGLKP